MSGFWQVTATSSPVTISAPAGAAAAGEVIRIRALAIMAAAAALTITDSNLGVVWQITPAAAGLVALTSLDIRGSPGGSLTIANTGSTGGINAEGDYCPIGYPYGLT